MSLIDGLHESSEIPIGGVAAHRQSESMSDNQELAKATIASLEQLVQELLVQNEQLQNQLNVKWVTHVHCTSLHFRLTLFFARIGISKSQRCKKRMNDLKWRNKK